MSEKPWGFYFRESWNKKQILRVLGPAGGWVDATKADTTRVAFVDIRELAALNVELHALRARVAKYERRAKGQREAAARRKQKETPA